MKVRSGATSGAAHTSNRGALDHPLALLHQQRTVVRVAGLAAIGMGELNEIAIASRAPARENNLAIGSGNDWSAHAVGNINTAMHAAPPPAITRRQGSLGWPEITRELWATQLPKIGQFRPAQTTAHARNNGKGLPGMNRGKSGLTHQLSKPAHLGGEIVVGERLRLGGAGGL